MVWNSQLRFLLLVLIDLFLEIFLIGRGELRGVLSRSVSLEAGGPRVVIAMWRSWLINWSVCMTIFLNQRFWMIEVEVEKITQIAAHEKFVFHVFDTYVSWVSKCDFPALYIAMILASRMFLRWVFIRKNKKLIFERKKKMKISSCYSCWFHSYVI